MKLALTVALVLTPFQIMLGDLHGLNTLHYQPAKLAAMEGIWNSGSGVPAVIFAVPNQKTHTNDFEISIPKLASLYLTHSWDGVGRIALLIIIYAGIDYTRYLNIVGLACIIRSGQTQIYSCTFIH